MELTVRPSSTSNLVLATRKRPIFLADFVDYTDSLVFFACDKSAPDMIMNGTTRIRIF